MGACPRCTPSIIWVMAEKRLRTFQPLLASGRTHWIHYIRKNIDLCNFLRGEISNPIWCQITTGVGKFFLLFNFNKPVFVCALGNRVKAAIPLHAVVPLKSMSIADASKVILKRFFSRLYHPRSSSPSSLVSEWRFGFCCELSPRSLHPSELWRPEPAPALCYSSDQCRAV